MPAVRAEGLSFAYRRRQVLVGISLEVACGEIVGLLGPNGAGKSTLLKVLATWLDPTSGSCHLLGFDLAKKKELRRRIGFMPLPDAHFENLTGWENAWLWASSFGLPADEVRRRLAALFGWLELEQAKDAPVSSYSYGMRRKLSLLEALVHRPRLLLLDEPSLGLDYGAQVRLRQQIRQLVHDDGVTVVLATNDVREAEELCTRVVFLSRGRVVACGAPQELLAPLRTRVRLRLTLGDLPGRLSGLVARVEGVESVLEEGHSLWIWAAPRPSLLADIAAGSGRAGSRGRSSSGSRCRKRRPKPARSSWRWASSTAGAS